MKKSLLFVLFALVILIGVVVVFMFFDEDQLEGSVTDIAAPSVLNELTGTKSVTTNIENVVSTTSSMEDSLFIGDSRTVGLSEYAALDGADFFAVVGMTVFGLDDASVSVPGMGDVTLTELLDSKSYGKVYIMLGINEIGYPAESILAEYGRLISLVKEKQPDAVIFIQANLHVTKNYSDNSNVTKNAAIDSLNSSLASFADGNTIYYLDPNSFFDDSNGCLAADKTSDGIHLNGDGYALWGEWIIQQTAILIA